MYQTQGERGRYIFDNAAASADAEDLTLLAELATDLGTRRVGTTDERNTLETKWKFPGLRFFDTTQKVEYVLLDSGTGLGWQRPTLTSTGVFLGAVNSAGNTQIAHGLPGAPNVQITQMQHPSLDANSRFFDTKLWGDPSPTVFRVRNIDRRDNSWAGDQQVRFSWLAVLPGV